MASKHPSCDPELDNLIELYGSDKNLSNYNLRYAENFKDIRNKVTSVLEIGVGSVDSKDPENKFSFVGNLGHYPKYTPGGSLKVWRDYFPNAIIHGVDIEKDCLMEEERLKTFIFNSMDLYECKKHLYNFKYDIIIDDGDHSAISQLVTLKNLGPLLKNGGIYVIEDLGGYSGYEEPDGTWYKPELLLEFKLELEKTVEKYGLNKVPVNYHPLTFR